MVASLVAETQLVAECVRADSGKRREKGSAERKTWAADARKRANVAAREPRTKCTKEATKDRKVQADKEPPQQTKERCKQRLAGQRS